MRCACGASRRNRIPYRVSAFLRHACALARMHVPLRAHTYQGQCNWLQRWRASVRAFGCVRRCAVADVDGGCDEAAGAGGFTSAAGAIRCTPLECGITSQSQTRHVLYSKFWVVRFRLDTSAPSKGAPTRSCTRTCAHKFSQRSRANTHASARKHTRAFSREHTRTRTHARALAFKHAHMCALVLGVADDDRVARSCERFPHKPRQPDRQTCRCCRGSE